MLPLVIDWFERAQSIATTPLAVAYYEAHIQRMKLSAIYDFIRGRPDVCVEAQTMQPLEISATQKKSCVDFLRELLWCITRLLLSQQRVDEL